MKVVSNTSPLVFLSSVDSLDMLSSCFNHIFIPEAVVNEFGKDQLPEIIDIHRISIEGKTFVDSHYGSLHRGELEAIQLARELNADLVLLDDLLARKKAKTLNLNVMGTLGIFLFACREGYISPLLAEQKIDVLVQEYDMYVASNLLENVKYELRSLNFKHR